MRLSILIAMLLAGCATRQPAYIRVCPSAPIYSKAFEQQAGSQLSQLPPGSPIVKMVTDYLSVRREIRTCQKG